MARHRSPVLLTLLIVPALGWSVWPWICPAGQGEHDVIAVFVEDPWRSQTALRLWRERPGSVLVFQGRDSSQRVNDDQLARRGLLPEDGPGLVRLTPGCDTVEQITALSGWLRRFKPPGQVTLVTGEAHMGRTLAIARITLASRGWTVHGEVAPTGDNRWEQPWRTLRDQLRSQLWRATGWSGRPTPAHCT